jgi:class 3 adenylate cyclase
MRCPACEGDNAEGARFCAACGERLAQPACPSCGAAVEAAQRFCAECGTSLAEAPPAAPPVEAEGERKQVTVLFCDIVGSTALAEHLGAEAMHELLGRFFELALAEVHRYGGTIDKFLGDGMMVTFGTDHAEPAACLNAVRTAILCQDALHAQREAGKTAYKMGVSIHYGRVYLARFIVDEWETQNTVIGRNVNLAGRLSSAAKKPMEEDEGGAAESEPAPQRALGMSVTVDADGQLFNEGIAISRAAFSQIEQQVELADKEEAGLRRMEFFDAEIKRRVMFRYAGDAKFKGVSTSFPVFEVDHQGS